MADGIRRTNVGANPGIDANINQVENNTEKEATSTNQPVLKYSNVRDSYQAAKPAINQNTTSPSDAQVKIDTSAANLLNEQLLSARLGTPLFKQTHVSETNLSAPLSNRAQLLPGIQSALDNVLHDTLHDAPSHVKKAGSKLSGFLSEIMATERKIESEKDAAAVNLFVSSVASAASATMGAAGISSGSALNDFVNKALKAGTQSSASDLSERMQKIRDLIDSGNTNSSKASSAMEEQRSMSFNNKWLQISAGIALTASSVALATFNFGSGRPGPLLAVEVLPNSGKLGKGQNTGDSIKDAAIETPVEDPGTQILSVLDLPEIVANVDAQRLGELRKKLEELLNS